MNAAFQAKSVDTHPSLGPIGGFGNAIALHAAGCINLSPIVTARFPLDDGLEAIERATERRDAKVLIHP